MKHGHRWLIGSGVVLALGAALGLIAAGGWVFLAEDGIVYVDADATGSGNGESWTDAYTDLQVALGAAVSGQQIWVAEGTYKPTSGTEREISFQMVKGVAIYGGFDPSAGDTEWEDRDWVNNVTILSGNIGDEGTDADNSYHVFYHAGGLDSSAVLDGFTISGGNANGSDPHNRGGGMRNSDGASPTLTNCTFSANSTGWDGGGMYNINSSPTLTGCTFSGNSAVWGGGMYNVDSLPTVTDCTFEGNSADAGGGAVLTGGSSSSAVFTNCTFSGNYTDGTGGAMRNAVGGSSVVTNCTFFGNLAANGSGMYNEGFTVEATNCILWGGSGSQISDGPGATVTVSFSDIQGGYNGEGNIDADPLFVDAGVGDLRLQLTSPAIDAGNNDAPGLAGITTDLGGHPRFADVLSVADTGNGDPPIVDMGAYEAPPDVIHVDQDATGSDDGTSWLNAFTDLQDALDAALAPAQIWVAAGTYKPTDDTDRAISFQMENGVAIYGGFDPTSGADTWEERDWVLHETVLSGDIGIEDNPDDNSYHVFFHWYGSDLDSTAILDGFTVSGGNANGDSPHSVGGGMLNLSSNPLLTNCTFTGNEASYGGGLYNSYSSPAVINCTFSGNSATNNGGGMYNSHSAPTVAGCTFTGNEASYGGGMYNGYSAPTVTGCTFFNNSTDESGGGMLNGSSSPLLTDCTFTGNSATDYGGGMHNRNHSSPTLTNCTFSGNSASFGGGMYNDYFSSPTLTGCTFFNNSTDESGGGMYNYYYSSPALTNCILWGDTAGGLPNEIWNGDSTPVVTYSDVQGGYTGEGNKDEDPLFVDPGDDDLHLGPGSPCIDAGSNEAPDLPEYDFEGDPRIMDGDGDGDAVVDMGVDEALWHPVYLPLVLRNY